MNKRKRNANKKHRKNVNRIKNLQKESLKLKKVTKPIKVKKDSEEVKQTAAKKAPAKKKTATKKAPPKKKAAAKKAPAKKKAAAKK